MPTLRHFTTYNRIAFLFQKVNSILWTFCVFFEVFNPFSCIFKSIIQLFEKMLKNSYFFAKIKVILKRFFEKFGQTKLPNTF